MGGNDVIQIISVVAIGATSLMVTSHLGRAFQRWIETRLPPRQPPPSFDEARLAATLADLRDRMAQLQQSVDASAVELERIGEADRYIARLVSERAPAPLSAPRAERVVTPH